MNLQPDKYIFIDRDGVINQDPQTESTYVNNWDEFFFVDNVKIALQKLTQAGYHIYIISNQAGVSKGFYTKEDLETITQNMLAEIEAQGGKIQEVLYCTHQNSDECNCRKPKPGLLLNVAKSQNIDLANYYFIGDSERDLIAAKNAGMKSILVLTGKTKSKDKVAQFSIQPDIIKKDLLEATEWLIKKDTPQSTEK